MKPYWEQGGNKFEEYCECGCGNKAPISTYSRKRDGRKKGKPIRFINGHNTRNKKFTDSHKKKIGEAQKASYARGDRKPMPSKILGKICKGCHNIFFIRFTDRANKHCSILCFNNWFSANFKGKNAPNYGKKHSEKTKKIISILNKGSKRSKETKKKMSEARKGMKFTKTHRLNLSESHRKTSLNLYSLSKSTKRKIRKCSIYKMWRDDVFERDHYQCQACDITNGNGKNVYLEAHHVKSFSEFPELRFRTSNGITLCLKCHKEIHKGIIVNAILEPERQQNISGTRS